MTSSEEWELLWARSGSICECGCGKYMFRTDFIVPAKAEKHHCSPRGMGGRPKKVYQLWEMRILRKECHMREHAEGCPHRVSWVEEMRERMGE
jgi:hypothetical protein